MSWVVEEVKTRFQAYKCMQCNHLHFENQQQQRLMTSTTNGSRNSN